MPDKFALFIALIVLSDDVFDSADVALSPNGRKLRTIFTVYKNERLHFFEKSSAIQNGDTSRRLTAMNRITARERFIDPLLVRGPAIR